MDDVTFMIRLLSDNWSKSIVDDGTGGDAVSGDGLNAFGHALPGLAEHRVIPTFVDVRSLEPNKGRRYDADQNAVIIVYEDNASITHPTIDWSVRNEEYTFTVHLRVLQPPKQENTTAGLTFSRDRLQSLYQIARYILERNGLQPKVYVDNDPTNAVEGSASTIEITGRNEANDRGKRLLGYKMSVTMKRFGKSV